MKNEPIPITHDEMDLLISQTRGMTKETIETAAGPVELFNVEGVSTVGVELPRFTDDIELAMMLYEEMPWPRKIEYHVLGSWREYNCDGKPGYMVSSQDWRKHEPRERNYFGLNKELTIAICTAWLQWKKGVVYTVTD